MRHASMGQQQSMTLSHACRGILLEMLDAAGLAANVADYPSLCGPDPF